VLSSDVLFPEEPGGARRSEDSPSIMPGIDHAGQLGPGSMSQFPA
jgi:hypothetical protein